MPALQLTPLATTACSPSPEIGILCSASSRPLPKPFRSPGPPFPFTHVSKHRPATLPPPAHCSHLRPSFGPHMEPSHSRAGIRGRCLLTQARCMVRPALTPHLTCLGVITLGSLPWGHYLGIITLGSNEWPEVARLGDPQSFPQTSALTKDQNIHPEHVGRLTGLCFAHVGPLYLHSCQEED